MTEYALYYTLNKNIKPVNLTVKQKTTLLNFLTSEDLDVDKKTAIILLITEHSRVVDNYEFDADNLILPYDLDDTVESDGSTLYGDLENLPSELQWILYKFATLKD